MITNENYEAYFIDFIEGRLSECKLSEFEKFLNQNPHLKEELKEYSEMPIVPNDVSFPE